MLRRAPAKKSAKGAQRRCIKGLLDPWLQVIEISGPILKDLTVSNHVRLLKKWKSRTIHKHFGGLDLIFSCPRYSFSVSPCFSGRAELRCFTLGEESHQSFKILGRSRQQKLFGDVPYPSQPHPT